MDKIEEILDYTVIPVPHGQYMLYWYGEGEVNPSGVPILALLLERWRCYDKKTFLWWSTPVTIEGAATSDGCDYIIENQGSGRVTIPEDRDCVSMGEAKRYIFEEWLKEQQGKKG